MIYVLLIYDISFRYCDILVLKNKVKKYYNTGLEEKNRYLEKAEKTLLKGC